jgi:hypothetical protein
MALERALQALTCWYEPKPLLGVFERLKSTSRTAASPALEYLGHVLPRGIFRPVRRIFEAVRVVTPGGEADDSQPAEQIRRAWESGDEWLRACAVRASRAVAGFDSSLFSTGADGGALVRAELAALAGRPPAPLAATTEELPC